MKISQNVFTVSYIFSVAIMLVAIVVSVLFLRTNFIKALSESDEITILRTVVINETLNQKQWDEVFSRINKKPNLSLSEINLKDPFDPSQL